MSPERDGQLSSVLLDGYVCVAAGQCHVPGYRACDQRDDHGGRHPCCHFTSQVSLGNKNAIHIWTTGILLCKFSKCLCLCDLSAWFTKLNLVYFSTEFKKRMF